MDLNRAKKIRKKMPLQNLTLIEFPPQNQSMTKKKANAVILICSPLLVLTIAHSTVTKARAYTNLKK